MRRFFSQVFAIIRKDLLLEYRKRELVISMLVFALLVLVIFNFAFDLRVSNKAAVGPGALWSGVLFSGILSVGRTVVVEKERGVWDALLLAPIEPGAMFTAKFISNLVFMVAVEVVLLPTFAAIFNLPAVTPEIAWILLLGTIGFASVGTLFSALIANSRAREVMMPVLLLPVLVPVVIATVKATEQVLSPNTAMGTAPWTALLAVFDVLYTTIGYLLFDYVAEE